MAYFGLSVNMVAFMFYVMHRPFSSSTNAVNNFLGISQASSVLGGFLADAYLGRYWTIAIFTTIYLAGLTGVTLCSTMNILVPNQDHCDQFALLLGNCEPAKPWQMFYLYTFLYITGFGAAGIRPCVFSFGADQFDERSKDYKSHLDRFFNFFYLSVTVGAIVAFTALVYIQMKHICLWFPRHSHRHLKHGLLSWYSFIPTQVAWGKPSHPCCTNPGCCLSKEKCLL